MRFPIIGLALAAAALIAAPAAAQKTTTPSASATGKKLDLKGTLYYQRADVEKVLGTKPEQGFVVVELTFTPKSGEEELISYDEFLLLSEKDGQRSQPLTPLQLAGNSKMVLSTVPGEAMVAQDSRGPTWGGIGGAPRRLGNDNTGFGNAAAPDSVQAQMPDENSDTPSDNPFLSFLKKQCLPEVKTAKPVSGLLIFPIEGKHKAKQFELFYKGPLGRLSLRWDKD